MEKFIEYLAKMKAHYYYTLYVKEVPAVRRAECLERVKMMDEHMLLYEVIGNLPPEYQKLLNGLYEKELEILKS